MGVEVSLITGQLNVSCLEGEVGDELVCAGVWPEWSRMSAQP